MPSVSATEFSSTEDTYKPTPCSAPPRMQKPNPALEGRFMVIRLMGYFTSREEGNCVKFGRSIPESDACLWRLSGRLDEVGILRRFTGDRAGDFERCWRGASKLCCQSLQKISWSLWGMTCRNNGYTSLFFAVSRTDLRATTRLLTFFSLWYWFSDWIKNARSSLLSTFVRAAWSSRTFSEIFLRLLRGERSAEISPISQSSCEKFQLIFMPYCTRSLVNDCANSVSRYSPSSIIF